jgi:hypothetical protein
MSKYNRIEKLAKPTRWSDFEQRCEILQNAGKIIDANYGEEIPAAFIHACLKINPRKVSQTFTLFFGATTSIYLKLFKIRCAHYEISCDPELSLDEIFMRTGMKGTPSDKRVFKNYYGSTAEEYWKEIKGTKSDHCDLKKVQAQEKPSATREATSKIEEVTLIMKASNGINKYNFNDMRAGTDQTATSRFRRTSF